MQDLIQLFTPNDIARKIGGDPSDVLAVLRACIPKSDAAAFEWVTGEDYTKPWPLSKSAERGDTLVDTRTEELCAKMHDYVTLRHNNGFHWEELRLQDCKKLMVPFQPFEKREFHRNEIARWLRALGVQSEFDFGQKPTGTPAQNATQQEAPTATPLTPEELAEREETRRYRPFIREREAVVVEAARRRYNELAAAPAQAAMPAPVETVEQRRARYLEWHTEEHRIKPRGAVQRVFEREVQQNPKADRSNIGKDIRIARGTAKTQKQAGAMFGQLVRDGKRQN